MSAEVQSVLERLEAVVGEIEQIRNVFQVASFSVGVVYHGKTVFTRGFGLANRETQLVPDEDTVYNIGSCTKAFTATAVSMLEERGKLDLDAPVSTKLPVDTRYNPVVGKEMTFRDMLSHCTGLASMLFAAVANYGTVFVEHEDIGHIVNYLQKAADFRTEWIYNNWLFALAGVLLVQENDGLSFGRVVEKDIFSPLNMTRSSTTTLVDENHAKPYIVLENGSFEPIKPPVLRDGMAFDSASSMRSCVRDMLLWTRALMDAWRETNSNPARDLEQHSQSASHKPCQPRRSDPTSETASTTCENKEQIQSALTAALATIQTPHFPIGPDPKQQYGLGLFVFETPTPQMNAVSNFDVERGNYAINEKSSAKLSIGHLGEYGGFLSAYWTYPEENASVVVLCNASSANGDPSNIVSQVLMQAMFDIQPRVDFVQISYGMVKTSKELWDSVVQEWTSHRVDKTLPKPLTAYLGTFVNKELALELEFSFAEGVSMGSDPRKYALKLRINGMDEQTFKLYHYDNDSWTFLEQTRDDCIQAGHWSYLFSWESFILDFDDLKNGLLQTVRWRLDPDKRVEVTSFSRSSKQRCLCL